MCAIPKTICHSIAISTSIYDFDYAFQAQVQVEAQLHDRDMAHYVNPDIAIYTRTLSISKGTSTERVNKNKARQTAGECSVFVTRLMTMAEFIIVQRSAADSAPESDW